MRGDEHRLGALERRRLMQRCELLCACGAKLPAIASPLSNTISQLLGGVAGSLFWMPRGNDPGGFVHESATLELKTLFAERFHDLFSGPEEENFVSLALSPGPLIGHMLDPAYRERFWRGNVYRYLSQPLGHRHFLDIRISDAEGPVGVMLVWRGEEPAFDLADVAAAQPIKALLDQAAMGPESDIAWRSALPGQPAHFITDIAGRRLLSISPAADQMLTSSRWIEAEAPREPSSRRPPPFVCQLAQALSHGGDAETVLTVADGRIVARASLDHAIDDSGERRPIMFVALDQQVALEVLAVEYLCDLPLTPLQRRIGLFGMTGGARHDVTARFAISGEATKKHLRAILTETGAATWNELSTLAEGLPRQAALSA